MRKSRLMLASTILAMAAAPIAVSAQVAPEEAVAIATDAYVYGYSLVTTGVTRIGRGTKIDNLVQVGHNVSIGEHVILVSQVGISGSSEIGDGAILAGQAGVADHVRVGPGARVGAQAGVLRNVAAGAAVAGFGPQRHGDLLRSQVVYEQLPQLRRRVIELERRLAVLGPAAGIPDRASGDT